MVCLRCINAVKEVLENLNIAFVDVKLGEATLQRPLSPTQADQLKASLDTHGFAVVSDRKSQLIERMKNLVVEQIHHSGEVLKVKWGDYIQDHLKMDYKYLSALFSSVEGITFEQFIILQKIERVKELIVYDELSLSEIAHLLDYSSVAYLSNQFKKITGMTPSQFKNGTALNRRSLDSI